MSTAFLMLAASEEKCATVVGASRKRSVKRSCSLTPHIRKGTFLASCIDGSAHYNSHSIFSSEDSDAFIWMLLAGLKQHVGALLACHTREYSQQFSFETIPGG